MFLCHFGDYFSFALVIEQLNALNAKGSNDITLSMINSEVDEKKKKTFEQKHFKLNYILQKSFFFFLLFSFDNNGIDAIHPFINLPHRQQSVPFFVC